MDMVGEDPSPPNDDQSEGSDLCTDEFLDDDTPPPITEPTDVYNACPDKVMQTKNDRIPALSKRNRINLLKYPETLRVYGPVRSLSELGWAGEANIQTVRPCVKKLQGLKCNWAFNVARLWVQKRFCRKYLSLSASESFPNSGPDQFIRDVQNFITAGDSASNNLAMSNYNHHKQFHVYGSREDVVHLMAEATPLSAIYLNGVVHVVIDKTVVLVVPLDLVPTSTLSYPYLKFYNVCARQTLAVGEAELLSVNPCLLLPHFPQPKYAAENETVYACYCLVNDKWPSQIY
jgi:hypothetical protein